jgi:hypothetical protein
MTGKRPPNSSLFRDAFANPGRGYAKWKTGEFGTIPQGVIFAEST